MPRRSGVKRTQILQGKHISIKGDGRGLFIMAVHRSASGYLGPVPDKNDFSLWLAWPGRLPTFM